MIANGYVCTTIDPETIRKKSESFLKKSIHNTEERESILRNLLKWCIDAKVGDHIIRDEFTIIVEKCGKELSTEKCNRMNQHIGF